METVAHQRPPRAMRTESGHEIEFKHEKGEFPQIVHIRGREQRVVSKHRTVCLVLGPAADGSNDRPVLYQGIAYCSPSDTFDREDGRQYALFDALQRIQPEKGKRRKNMLGPELMTAYLGRPGAKPWRLDKYGHKRFQPNEAQLRSVVKSLAQLVKVMADGLGESRSFSG